MKFFPVLFIMLFFCLKASAEPYLINVEWFKNFNDDILFNYVLEALEHNKDALIAKSNILKYRQEKNLSISKEFPTVNVGANYLLLKIPKLAIPNNDIQTNSFALPFMMVWEVDYLGKNYNKIQKARLDMESAKADLKAAELIAAVDLAAAYFNASNLNSQLILQEKIKNLQEDIFFVKQKMFDYGTIGSVELDLAKDALYNEENALLDLKAKRETFLTQMAYILGKSPASAHEIKLTPFENINFTGKYPESLNGGIISNRPDILAAENEIKKAKIDITIAKKDFLPSINVFGLLVFSTFVQNFGWDGVFANLLAGATQNLFDGGKRIFNLKKAKTEYEAALQTYLQKDLNALKELNDALYILKSDYKVYENDKRRLELANSNFVKIFKSYRSGVKNKIDYLSENTTDTRASSVLANSKNRNFINLLTLFKAAGGAL